MSDRDVPGESDEPLHEPIGESLDLHHFRPSEAADLVNEYLLAAREAGFTTVRIIHGKGLSQLKKTVHRVLEGHPAVSHFANAPDHLGGWGATVVQLKTVE